MIGFETGNQPEKPRKLGRTPLDTHDIPPGDYLLLLSHPDCVELRYPVRMGRGERRELSLVLLRPSQVPEAMVYVAGGPFLFGDVQSGTVRPVEVPGFFIDRTEVTGADYERFTQATGTLPPDSWERSRTCPAALPLEPRPQRELVRRLCLRAVGRQAAPDRDRVGKGSSRRRRPAVPLGKPVRPAKSDRPPRHPSRPPACRPPPRRRQSLWLPGYGWQRLGVDNRSRALRRRRQDHPRRRGLEHARRASHLPPQIGPTGRVKLWRLEPARFPVRAVARSGTRDPNLG